jgi:N-methylhydantoinase A
VDAAVFLELIILLSGFMRLLKVAVNSNVNSVHEEKIKEILIREIPDVRVSLSSVICPEVREYERTSTVAINAYLTQTVQKHLESFEQKLYDLGLKSKLQIMQSSGGVTASKYITDKPVNIFMSGPAGGVVASSYMGGLDEKKDNNNIIAVDMGGTSFDITILPNGKIPLSMRSMIHGWHIIAPTIDIQTIGSGGGSIAWVDEGRGLHVGSQSAGSNPGPVSYMKGGEEPTVTDADLVLGYIDPNYFLGGEMKLNIDKARASISRLSDKIGLSTVETAAGIYSIVNENMLGGMRLVTLERGYDPREYTLYVFGGAAAVHVPHFAPELGIKHIIVPRDAAVFSAYGLVSSETRFDFIKNISRNTKNLPFEELRRDFNNLVKQGNDCLEESLIEKEERYFQFRADMKYPGEKNEFIFDISSEFSSMEELVGWFGKYHEDMFGYAENIPPDITNIRVSAFGRSMKPVVVRNESGGSDSLRAVKGVREAYFHEMNGIVEVQVYDGQQMVTGDRFAGPAIIELPTTTILVRPGQSCYVDELSNFNIIIG